MRVLVTNDDGVWAPGLHALAAALVADDRDVVIAAPRDDHSGAGAGVGPWHLGNGVDYDEVEVPAVPGVPAFAIDGPPALAVMVARLGGFGPPPDFVASGINPGSNTGRAVLHSGTVGAALTGAGFGVSGVAVSLKSGEEWHHETAAAYAVRALRWLEGQPPKTVLNVNVPNVPLDEVLGVRTAALAPFGTVRAAIAGVNDGRLQMELRDTNVELPPDTDTALVNAGYVAVTSLRGITSAGETDAADFLA